MKKFISFLILGMFVAIIAVLVYSVAIGQETLDAVIKDGQVVIYKTTKIQKEIIPLPDKELGISDENAKRVCLAEERAITATEEIDKKINFCSFPFVKTKTIWQKEIWYDKYDGWQSLTLCPKKISENIWSMTISMIVLFFSFLFLSCSAWRNKKIGGLFKSYFFIVLSCSLFAIYTACLTIWAIAITITLGLVFGSSAWVASVNIISQENDHADADFFIIGGVAILIIFNIILAIVTADYNSTLEFISTLLLIMATTCFIGWLISERQIDIKLEEADTKTNGSLHK